MTLGQICWELKSKVAGTNWLMSCLENFQTGKKFRGRDFVGWNIMAKTYDMLYVRRQFGTNTIKSHIIEHTAPVKRPAPAIAAGLETPLKALKPGGGDGRHRRVFWLGRDRFESRQEGQEGQGQGQGRQEGG